MQPLADRLKSLAYFQAAPLPDLALYDAYDLSDPAAAKQVEETYRFSTRSYGEGNRLLIHREAGPSSHPTPLHFYGRNNTVLIDKECTFHGNLSCYGSDNLAVFFGGQGDLGLAASFYDGDTLIWGRKASAWGASVWVQGGTVLTVGDECLLSHDISIRTTDHHSIIDLETYEQVNRPADVTLGHRVWLSQGTSVNKGVTLGDGAIIGARSTVTKDVPSCELWAGAPARMLRQNVSWTMSHPIAPGDEIERLRAFIQTRR